MFEEAASWKYYANQKFKTQFHSKTRNSTCKVFVTLMRD